jgi:hypothetical protein
MVPKIKIVLLLVVALGVILFVLRSGVVGKLESIGSLNFWPSSSSSAPWYLASSTKPASGGGGTPWYLASSSQPAGNFENQNGQPAINPSEIPQGFTLKDLSPYFHKIRLSSISPGGYFGGYGQISLSASFNPSMSLGTSGGAINVSGWLLQANKGGQYVPQAVGIYDPSGLAAEGDIYLKNSDVLNIYTLRSAIGKNLRLNKCIGYLENTNHFTPSLPMNCQYTDRSDIAGLSGVCQNYITSLGSCALPAANPRVPENDYACRAYLDNLNYKGCFDKHRSDADFLSNEWRAWIGSTFLDSSHDRLLLLDRQGLVVDVYSY